MYSRSCHSCPAWRVPPELTVANVRVSFPHVHVQVHPAEGWVILISPALIFTRGEVAAFPAGAKDGESDDYAG
jgi:hypothetical protein